MRKPKEKIKLETKKVYLAQYGGTEDDTVVGEFETIENQHSKYANAIGSFVISFAELENSVNNELATAINERAHEPGYRIIKYLSFRNKIDLFNDHYSAYVKVFRSKPTTKRMLAELKIIYNKLCELSEFRNKVAHADWTSLDKTGFVTTKILENKDDFGIQLEKVKMTPGVLVKFRKQNEALSVRINAYREKVWEINNREYASQYKKNNAREGSLKLSKTS